MAKTVITASARWEVPAMPRLTHKLPSYRLHKPSGRAVATLDGKDHYLGVYNFLESRAEYDRLIVLWLQAKRRNPAAVRSKKFGDLTVEDTTSACLIYANTYYREDGQPTKELANIRLALRPLQELFGPTLASDFGPLALKAVRRTMSSESASTVSINRRRGNGKNVCRTEINRRIGRIVRCFKWAVSEEMIPATIH
jgi:hypothetical protein